MKALALLILRDFASGSLAVACQTPTTPGPRPTIGDVGLSLITAPNDFHLNMAVDAADAWQGNYAVALVAGDSVSDLRPAAPASLLNFQGLPSVQVVTPPAAPLVAQIFDMQAHSPYIGRVVFPNPPIFQIAFSSPMLRFRRRQTYLGYPIQLEYVPFMMSQTYLDLISYAYIFPRGQTIAAGNYSGMSIGADWNTGSGVIDFYADNNFLDSGVSFITTSTLPIPSAILNTVNIAGGYEPASLQGLMSRDGYFGGASSLSAPQDCEPYPFSLTRIFGSMPFLDPGASAQLVVPGSAANTLVYVDVAASSLQVGIRAAYGPLGIADSPYGLLQGGEVQSSSIDLRGIGSSAGNILLAPISPSGTGWDSLSANPFLLDSPSFPSEPISLDGSVTT